MPSHFLTSALQWLDERIAQDQTIGPDLFQKLVSAERAQGLLHGTRPLCPFLHPHIISRSEYETIRKTAETLAGAFEQMVKCALQNDALLDELGLTEREAVMARFDPGYQRLCVTSRLDSFRTEDGYYFIEYNAESPAGIPDQMVMEDIFYQLPHMQEFLKRYPHWKPNPRRRLLESLLEAYREWGGKKEFPQIGIIDWKDVETVSEFEVLKAYFESQGYPTLIADPHNLEFDGEELRCGEFVIDIFYKRVIIHEFLEKFDETHPFSQAYAQHKVCMANSFRAKIAHKKAGFAILSDPQYEHLFSPEQLAAIHQHIPWTRRVKEGKTVFHGKECDLVELLRQEQERLVLKPNDDYGGHGVVIGWETDPSRWEQTISNALAHDFVAQERVPVQKVTMQVFSDHLESQDFLVDFNPFLFNNQMEGAFVRLSTSSLVNISAGGGETSLLVLEDC